MEDREVQSNAETHRVAFREAFLGDLGRLRSASDAQE